MDNEGKSKEIMTGMTANGPEIIATTKEPTSLTEKNLNDMGLTGKTGEIRVAATGASPDPAYC
jgi:hypothetical protein